MCPGGVLKDRAGTLQKALQFGVTGKWEVSGGSRVK